MSLTNILPAAPTKNIFKFFLFVFISFSFVYAIFTVVRIIFFYELQDFNYYVEAVRSLRQSGLIYSDPPRFNYPPTSLLIFFPFIRLTGQFAPQVWTLISFISLLWTIYFSWQSSGTKPTNPQGVLTSHIFSSPQLISFALLFLYFPFKFVLGMGNVHAILTALLLFTFWAYKKEKFLISSIALVAATILKITPGLLLIFFILKGQWKIVKYFLIFFLLATITTSLIVGTNNLKIYFKSIVPSYPIASASYLNQGISGVLARINMSDKNIKLFTGVIFILALVIYLFNQPKNEFQNYSFLILTITLFMGFAWTYYYVALIPTFIILQSKWSIITLNQKLLLITCYLLIAANLKTPSLYPLIIHSHTFIGGVGLWLLLLKTKT